MQPKASPGFLKQLNASEARISESCCDATTFHRIVESADADRVHSVATLVGQRVAANQLRPWFASIAYVPVNAMHRIALHDTRFADAVAIIPP
jgi:hypothetical protein